MSFKIYEASNMFASTRILDILQENKFTSVVYGNNILNEYLNKSVNFFNLITDASFGEIKKILSSYYFTIEKETPTELWVVDRSYLTVKEEKDSSLDYIFKIKTKNSLKELLESGMDTFCSYMISFLNTEGYIYNYNSLCYLKGIGLIDFNSSIVDIIELNGPISLNKEKQMTEKDLFMGLNLYLNYTDGFFSNNFIEEIKEYIKQTDFSIKDFKEIEKLLVCKYPLKIKFLYEIGLLEKIIPEVSCLFEKFENKEDKFSIGDKTLKVLNEVYNDLEIREAAIFYNTGKLYKEPSRVFGLNIYMDFEKESLKVLKKYLGDSKQYKKVGKLLYIAGRYEIPTENGVINFCIENNINNETFMRKYFTLRLALLMQNIENPSEDSVEECIEFYSLFKKISKKAWTLFDINIDDEDILNVLADPNQLLFAKNIARKIIIKYPNLNKKDYILFAITSNTNIKLKDKDIKIVINSFVDNNDVDNLDDFNAERNRIIDNLSSINQEQIDSIIQKFYANEYVNDYEIELYNNWMAAYSRLNALNGKLKDDGKLNEVEELLWETQKNKIIELQQLVLSKTLSSKYFFETDTELFELLYSD